MDNESVKRKEFDWKWINLCFVYKRKKPSPFSKWKEIGFWFNPSECVNFDSKRSPEEFDYHLDKCYDFGIRINRTRMWVSIKFKTGK